MVHRIFITIRAVAVAVTAMALAAAAAAQTGGATPQTGNQPGTAAPPSPTTNPSRAVDAAAPAALTRADRRSVEEAAQGGMMEVQLGKLAQEKAQSEQVRQFAGRMVQDHSKANDELKQLAESKGMQLPTALDRSHRRDMERLQKLSGAAFDREYMQHMVADHRKDVSSFQKQANSANDSAIKAFASKTLPVLQEHLKLAQSTHETVKTVGRAPN